MPALQQLPGRASHLLQEAVHREMAEQAGELSPATQTSSPPSPPVIPPTVATNAGGAEDEAPRRETVIDPVKVEQTGRIPLAALPDNEIMRLLEEQHIDAKAFKSREEAVAALEAKGITSISSQS